MTHLRIGLTSILAGALLAACGGGDTTIPGSGAPAGAPAAKGTFTSVVSFGDSLTDLGAYTPATSVTQDGKPPYLGGKFTNNVTDGAGNNVSAVWVENVARTVLATPAGLPAITAAEVGFAGQSVKCPIAAAVPALAKTCTGYGQAGSLVTSPVGYKHDIGFLTVPVKTQIANHLTRFGSFKDSDLILVSVGFNEVFFHFEKEYLPAFFASLQKKTDGKITDDEFKAEVFHAQTLAQDAMKTAALELADLVRTQILAKGGKYVAVTTLIDMTKTPEAMALPLPLPEPFLTAVREAVKPMLNLLPQTFDLWLREGLTGQAVQILDARTVFDDMTRNPATYGFVDIKSKACDAAKMPAASGGSSLFCNTTPGTPFNMLTTGADTTTWLFADGVHPTNGGHKAFSDAFLKQLKAFGWI